MTIRRTQTDPTVLRRVAQGAVGEFVGAAAGAYAGATNGYVAGERLGKKMVDKMNGRIEIKSELGRGTEVKIFIPFSLR